MLGGFKVLVVAGWVVGVVQLHRLVLCQPAGCARLTMTNGHYRFLLTRNRLLLKGSNNSDPRPSEAGTNTNP